MSQPPPPFVPYAHAPPPEAFPFRDRRRGLKGFGITMIVLGALCGCMTLTVPLALVSPEQTRAGGGAGNLLVAGLIYICTAVLLIWTGSASFGLKRWVRPIVLVFSTLTIFFGLVVVVSTIVLLPNIRANAPTQAQAMMGPIMYVSAGCMSVLMIVLPALFIAYYAPDDTRLTLERFDPRPRWTDGVPIPLVGLSVGLVLFGAMTLMSVFQPVYSMYGCILTGAAMYMTLTIVAALTIGTGVMCYRREPAAWYLSVLLVIALGAGSVVNAFRLDPEKLIATLELDSDQEKIFRATAAGQPMLQAIFGIGASVLGLGYVIYCRQFFLKPPVQTS